MEKYFMKKIMEFLNLLLFVLWFGTLIASIAALLWGSGDDIAMIGLVSFLLCLIIPFLIVHIIAAVENKIEKKADKEFFRGEDYNTCAIRERKER